VGPPHLIFGEFNPLFCSTNFRGRILEI